jgi:hypothetical protein
MLQFAAIWLDMSITLSVYDIFAYATPGATYLTLLTYIFARLKWIDPQRLLDANTTLLVIGLALACYLSGYITYPVGRALSRVIPAWRKDMDDARKMFVRRVPAAKERPFLQADRSTLQAAIEVHGIDTALEMTRLRAIGLMLRNVAPALALGAITSLVEAIRGDSVAFATSFFVILALAAAGSLWQAGRLTHWADMKTLELAFWIPGIDNSLFPQPNKSSASQRKPLSVAVRRTVRRVGRMMAD